MQGKDAVPFLEKLVVGDVAGITNGSGSLSVFTNEKGGIIDDTVITKVHSCREICSPRAHECACTIARDALDCHAYTLEEPACVPAVTYLRAAMTPPCTRQVADDEIYLVVNAGCREKDLAHIGKHLDKYQVPLILAPLAPLGRPACAAE
jgi:glycine cleavage system aminomethyltransferase T